MIIIWLGSVFALSILTTVFGQAIESDQVNSDTLDTSNVNNIDYIAGIDVSHYQGNIDWLSLERQPDINFVYIKVSEGAHHTDSKFFYNWLEAQKSKLLYGGYHFFKPDVDSKHQARWFLQNINFLKSMNGILPPVLDVEVLGKLSKEDLIKEVEQWLNLVESETKCKPLIYTNYNFWKSYLADSFQDYGIWIADYKQNFDNIIEPGNYIFWQFQQDSMVFGIEGLVDKSKFIGDNNELSNLVCGQ
jgi:lysozyme